jgi:hypothetical protein
LTYTDRPSVAAVGTLSLASIRVCSARLAKYGLRWLNRRRIAVMRWVNSVIDQFS